MADVVADAEDAAHKAMMLLPTRRLPTLMAAVVLLMQVADAVRAAAVVDEEGVVDVAAMRLLRRRSLRIRFRI